MRINFSFIYPVTKKLQVHKIGSRIYDHVADLVVNGIANLTTANVLNNISDRYSFEINEILLEGSNIYPNAELMESLDNIKAACRNHIEQLLEDGKNEERAPVTRMYPALAKVITLPLKRKIR